MTIYNTKQKAIAEKIETDITLDIWKDYKWQLKNVVIDIDTFQRLTGIIFNDNEREELEKTIAKFPLSITPYYLSLINTKNYLTDPIFKQAFPDPYELRISKYDKSDPLSEDIDKPAPNITHRYPDRILFLISNTCSMYCRHCTRKRKVGDIDSIPLKSEIKKGIDYIKNTPEIRDVLLSGGDPFMLSTGYLD